MPARIVYLGLGSNLSDRLRNLQTAVQLIADRIKVNAVSGIYESKAEGYNNAPDFLNMVLAAETALPLENLLVLAKVTEAAMGRKISERNAPRIIDVDILCAEDEVPLDTPTLSVPHKAMHQRAFVLAPLNELCPQYIHQLTKKSVEEMLGELQGEDAEYWGELNMAF
ncbi:MAG: 2-amino-4-hydroxy-6-hydroxymethyldihydropteridine diphosphokinase [Chloroflexi bacterium]|nr:2-amino-4-hydroxy-6-hydroxymethyldihydropteridine diphosphokinase [Chloroflexota bacterium]